MSPTTPAPIKRRELPPPAAVNLPLAATREIDRTPDTTAVREVAAERRREGRNETGAMVEVRTDVGVERAVKRPGMRRAQHDGRPCRTRQMHCICPRLLAAQRVSYASTHLTLRQGGIPRLPLNTLLASLRLVQQEKCALNVEWWAPLGPLRWHGIKSYIVLSCAAPLCLLDIQKRGTHQAAVPTQPRRTPQQRHMRWTTRSLASRFTSGFSRSSRSSMNS